MAGGSTRVILTALAANVGIAIAKFVAAGITGSSAMLTEGVHSLVDSTNHVLLLYGSKRAHKKADGLHPLGYGRELYFWSFVVAILVFALGAGVAIYEGILHILEPVHAGDPKWAYGVLAVAFVLEGWSTWEAMRTFSRENKGKSLWRAIRSSKDAPTIVVLLENTGAILGIIIAALGIAISQWTHNPVWDGVASVLIGLVLAGVAIWLVIEAKGLLIGESADPELNASIKQLAQRDCIEEVREVVTVHEAPDIVFAGLTIDFKDDASAADIERALVDIERDVHASHPIVKRVFLRPYANETRIPDLVVQSPA